MKYGLGVDQVIGARYVNGDGELVDADQDTLKAIRGGGGSFGVITELTIKVYELGEVSVLHPITLDEANRPILANRFLQAPSYSSSLTSKLHGLPMRKITKSF